jgi:hypothetical protein
MRLLKFVLVAGFDGQSLQPLLTALLRTMGAAVNCGRRSDAIGGTLIAVADVGPVEPPLLGCGETVT